MLVKINDGYFVNPKNVTYARLIENGGQTMLNIHFVGGDRVAITIDNESSEEQVGNILRKVTE